MSCPQTKPNSIPFAHPPIQRALPKSIHKYGRMCPQPSQLGNDVWILLRAVCNLWSPPDFSTTICRPRFRIGPMTAPQNKKPESERPSVCEKMELIRRGCTFFAVSIRIYGRTRMLLPRECGSERWIKPKPERVLPTVFGEQRNTAQDVVY